MGFWLILPFAGLEAVLFAWLGYRVCSATYHQQVVILSNNHIEVQWGSGYPKQSWRFERARTRLEVIRPHHSLSPHRLFLRDDNQVLPIAEKLNQEDVGLTIDQFRCLGLPTSFSGETVTRAANDF